MDLTDTLILSYVVLLHLQMMRAIIEYKNV